jgi:hypothetical protein
VPVLIGAQLNQFNRPLKEFLALQSRNSGRMEISNTTGSASPAPLVRNTWKARMLTITGPNRSKPKFRVFGIATRIPPETSMHFINAKYPVGYSAAKNKAGGEPSGGFGCGGKKFKKKFSPKTTNNRPSRPPTMFAAHFIVLLF